MANVDDGPEELPHRAKSKGKPRKRDRCPENNGKHLYVVVKEVTKYPSGNEYTSVRQECLGCGKCGKDYRNYSGEVYDIRVDEIKLRRKWTPYLETFRILR